MKLLDVFARMLYGKSALALSQMYRNRDKDDLPPPRKKRDGPHVPVPQEEANTYSWG